MQERNIARTAIRPRTLKKTVCALPSFARDRFGLGSGNRKLYELGMSEPKVPAVREDQHGDSTVTSDRLHVRTFVTGEFATNCFIFWKVPDAVCVVDPGAEPESMLTFLKKRNITVAAYLLTHGHMDHIGALASMASVAPAPCFIHEEDSTWTFTSPNSWEPFYPEPVRPTVPVLPIPPGNKISKGGMQITVLHTPGHTGGSVCYVVADSMICFSGDTLFAGSVGRTDLPGGDPVRMRQSLASLCKLENNLRVYPGHGPVTSIGREKIENPYLAGL